MVHPAIPKVTAYLEELSNASLEYFPGSILQGIQAIHVGKGIVQCKLIIEDRVLGEDGTIHTGAIAALMENIGATVIFSAGGSDHASVDFNYSLYSTAKKQDRNPDSDICRVLQFLEGYPIPGYPRTPNPDKDSKIMDPPDKDPDSDNLKLPGYPIRIRPAYMGSTATVAAIATIFIAPWNLLKTKKIT
ncbi:hypothetical protein DY000_02010375 [Brassica cretica]|uniref:Uncharacterized protein n=1 Tax=Brassica cretica TaxID=69181 RepID=A0ABQ7CDR4_BRACR|nr:hypothetical protein DY000_02010375 [Brassica cretica]